ncbi:MAG: thioredoxin domain-containing protein [Propionibacteriaceae bacterium]|jgi:protein-disulfide isomerase|nr:thioredoxin domain-containing protein [Propionibacteriaceae bacterium]
MASSKRKPQSSSSAARVSRREQLEAQRQALAQRQRRNRLITVLAGVLGVALVVSLTVWGINSNKNSGGDEVPPNATAKRDGITITPTLTDESTPLLVIYSDFQCPGCKSVHDAISTVLQQAVDSGRVRIEFHTLIMLDYANTQVGSPNLRSSTRATVAAACADTVGVYYPFYSAIYANQPATEGDGYSDDLLRVQIPTEVGLSGDQLTRFQTCYDNQSTGKFTLQVDEAAAKAGITGTPRIWLNGEDITAEVTSAASPANKLKQLLNV